MKSRVITSIAIAATVILGATGCSMTAPHATTIQYSPAEGINMPRDSGPVDVLNTLVVANDEGTEGSLIAAFVNNSQDAQTLELRVADETFQVRLDGKESISLGVDDVEPFLVQNLGAKPGETIEVFVKSGDSEGGSAHIVVYDGTLPYLEPFVPADESDEDN